MPPGLDHAVLLQAVREDGDTEEGDGRCRRVFSVSRQEVSIRPSHTPVRAVGYRHGRHHTDITGNQRNVRAGIEGVP